jgi:repressor LexA
MNDTTPTVTLYKRQRQIVEYISQFIQRNGYSPTLREIGDAMGLSSLATVHEHIERLCKKGVLKKTQGNRTRGIVVVDERFEYNSQGINLPVLGWFSAGRPIEAYTEAGKLVQVSGELVSGKKRAFILEVRDNTMLDEGVLKGDFLILEEDPDINDSDVVVAILESGMATLKRFFKEQNRIRLEPVSTDNQPMYVARIQVQGKCTGVVRRFRVVEQQV